MNIGASLKILTLGSVMIFAQPATSAEVKEQKPPAQTFAAEIAQAELGELYERLRDSHFDLYVHRTREDYDAFYQQMRESFAESMSHFDLQVALQRFMAYGRVAHSRIDFPALEFERFRAEGGKIAPLNVKLRDGRIFVVSSLLGLEQAQPQPGDEILALNGEPAERWRERLLAHVSADNDYLADTLLELQFSALLWLEIGAVEQIELRIRRVDGQTQAITLPTRNREQMRAAHAKLPPSLALNWSKREARMLENRLAYLRPGPFYNDDPKASSMWDNSAFATFIDHSFSKFTSAQANTLLIDLRDNPGGDNSFSDLLLRRYADQPFRFCSSFKIKVSAATTASNAARLAQGDSEISAEFAELYANQEPGDLVDFQIPMVDPAPDNERFNGEVYALINRYSYSNAVMVAAMSQDYEFATIIGEETADLASTYGAMEQFSLSRTGISVGYPKAHIVRPSGDTQSRGVVPDIKIDTPLLEGAEDPVLQATIKAIDQAT